MSKFNDDYDGYIAHIKNIQDKDIRKDVVKIIKWSMIKRSIIKISEIAIISLSIAGVIPSFL